MASDTMLMVLLWWAGHCDKIVQLVAAMSEHALLSLSDLFRNHV